MGNIDNLTFMSKYSAFNPFRLQQRELGFPTPVGSGDAMAKSLYCGMKPIASWEFDREKGLPTGGIFNLEFSPEGSLLVAACEKQSIQIFDPLTHKRIHSVNEAHTDCVNCVKFLDGRMFATCSDDTTIALWDVRNLKKKIRSLLGHSKWVKNIEFSVKDQLLVSSGLDGSIYTWDINCYTEYNLLYQRVFHTSSLMRCRLSPDARQMVMCTTGGLLIIIHDLNLTTLAKDLHGFKPNLYRLMQMSQQLIPIAAMYDHLFDSNRKENRVEFVSDFPDVNDAMVVSALQIHPQGWSALSRNISNDDRSEWTCIHDIQPNDGPLHKSTRDTTAEGRGPEAAAALAERRLLRRRLARRPRLRPYRLRPPPADAAAAAAAQGPSTSDRQTEDRELEPEPGPSSARTEARTEASSAAAPDVAQGDRVGPGMSRIQNDVWEAAITIKQHRMLQEMYSRGQVRRNFNMQRITGINTGIAPPVTLSDSSVLPSSSGHTPPQEGATEQVDSSPPIIRQNRDRLLYYIEETNEGKGFIKELCYSADGRLVCSPFGRGMRLLALRGACSEQSACVAPPPPHPPRCRPHPAPLVDVGQSLGLHRDLVVSSRFSPRHPLLVTGCLEGKIVWYQPHH